MKTKNGRTQSVKLNETFFKCVFLSAAVLSVAAVAAILIFLLIRGLPALNKIGFFKFIFTSVWKPSTADTLAGEVTGSYGILPMLAGTVYSAAGALLIGGTLGVFTAIYLAKFCPPRLKKPLTQVINLLAGIPSIIFGFFGMTVLLPIVGLASANGSGSGILSVSIILGIMIMPTVTALSKTSIEAVDGSYYDGAVALGSSHEQAVFKAVVPAARKGITASIVLGLGRAVGETMAVVMLAGGNARFPNGLISSFRTMTGNIVMEMSYAGELHLGALVGTGVVLLLFILIINFLFLALRDGGKSKGGRRGLFKFLKRRARTRIKAEPAEVDAAYASARHGAGRLSKTGKNLARITTALGVGGLLLIVGFIMVKGIPNINGKLFGAFDIGDPSSVVGSLIATFMTIILTAVIAFPVGIFTAVYLTEYTKKGSIAVKIIRYAVDTLSAVPSIVFGLFGMIFFCGVLGMGTSILAGCFTVSLMIIPTTVRAAEEAILAVPESYREGSYALGGGKLRTVTRVVLPSALPGILAAVILGTGRVTGESAPFVFTMGASLQPNPTGYKSAGTTLAVAVYALAREGIHTDAAYAAACILIAFVLGLNLLAAFIGGKLQNRLSGKVKVKNKGAAV